MNKEHHYRISVTWTGNKGQGTSGYTAYSRDHLIRVSGKPDIPATSDTAFRGSPGRFNPEELFVSALSSCHMLWYLHLASNAGIIVNNYRDNPVGHGETLPSGAGRFLSAVLRPTIMLQKGADLELAAALHQKVHAFCFIARSVNFPVSYEPTFHTEEA